MQVGEENFLALASLVGEHPRKRHRRMEGRKTVSGLKEAGRDREKPLGAAFL